MTNPAAFVVATGFRSLVRHFTDPESSRSNIASHPGLN